MNRLVVSSEEASYTDSGKETSEDMDKYAGKQAIVSELSGGKYILLYMSHWLGIKIKPIVAYISVNRYI